MDRAPDTLIPLAAETPADDFGALERRDVSTSPRGLPAAHHAAPAIALLAGFNLLEQPLVRRLDACPDQVIACRSTVALGRALIGREVLVLFEAGDVLRPIIVGVIETPELREVPVDSSGCVGVQVDGIRHVIEAERELVLRCGEASITLTRAGKVIIRGTYILSRSSGYNRIKGAAIELN